FDEVLFGTDAIVDEFHSRTEEDSQYYSHRQSSQRELEAVRERSLVRQAGRIDEAKLFALLLPLEISGQRGPSCLLGQSVVSLFRGFVIGHDIFHLRLDRRSLRYPLFVLLNYGLQLLDFSFQRLDL